MGTGLSPMLADIKIKEMKILIRVLLIVLGIGVVGFVVYFLSILHVFGAFDKYYNENELISHFNEKQDEFNDLISFFESVVPEDKEIEIEFEDKNTLSRFGVISIDTALKSRTPLYLEWDLNIDKDIPNSIITAIKWNRQTFETLKSKLDKAGCIQIESGNPVKIGFQRSGMGMYSYYLFRSDSLDSNLNEQKKRNDLNFFSDTTAWEYDGGAMD